MPHPRSSVPRWQRALITGASSGIGEAFARELAEAGTHLVLVARRTDRLAQIADELRQHGIEIEILGADLSQRSQVQLVAARLADEADPIDLLINNAGSSVWGQFDQQPIEVHEELLAVLVTAPMVLTHAAASAMALRGRGTILNISSTCGNGPVPQLASYGGAKAFINNFSQAVAAELGRSRVVVTTVVPGLTRTPIHEVSGQPIDTSSGAWMDPRSVARHALKAAAAGRRHVITGRRNRVESLFTPRYPYRLGGRILRVALRPTLVQQRWRTHRAARNRP